MEFQRGDRVRTVKDVDAKILCGMTGTVSPLDDDPAPKSDEVWVTMDDGQESWIDVEYLEKL